MPVFTIVQNVWCWRERLCAACQQPYRHMVMARKVGKGRTRIAAQEESEKADLTALPKEACLPCPRCGAYPAEVAAIRRRQAHLIVAACVLLLCATLVVICIGEASVAYLPLLSYSFAIVALIYAAVNFALLHVIRTRISRAPALMALNEGTLEMLPEQAKRHLRLAEMHNPRKSIWPVLLMASTAFLLVAAEGWRLVQGWPTNERCIPPVVGPGDSVTFLMPAGFSSIQKKWAGQAEVTVLNADELGPQFTERLVVTSRRDHWGTTIRAKSSESAQSVTPWIRINVPDQPDLAGRTAQLDIVLHVTYPMKVGHNFDEQEQTFQTRAALAFAPAGAGRTYFWLALGGMALAALVLAAASARMAWLAAPHSRSSGCLTPIAE